MRFGGGGGGAACLLRRLARRGRECLLRSLEKRVSPRVSFPRSGEREKKEKSNRFVARTLWQKGNREREKKGGAFLFAFFPFMLQW